MNLILLGAPGCGKGTQSAFLTDKFKIVHISTGDILRAAISDGTDLGNKAKEYMDKGELVPDQVVIGIVKETLNKPDTNNGFLLDGFPRTVPQAEALDEALRELEKELDAVVNIEVSDEEIMTRLTGRRVCTKCGEVYHMVFDPPKTEGFCDICQSPIEQRSDDTVETVKKRLNVYKEQTEPLINYYEKEGILRVVNGEQTPKAVFDDIKSAIQGDD